MDYTTSIAQHHHHHHHHHRHLHTNRQDHRHPSFSSTLLDQIYNSIDDSSSPLPSIKTKTQNQNRTGLNRHETTNYDFIKSRNHHKIIEPVLSKNSSSSSSDSTGFSSSESDSFYKRSKSSSSIPHPKPIRTGTTVDKSKSNRSNNKQNQEQQHQKDHGTFLRTKSRASKIYSDLKQPISPGGRIATFLNSIFTTKKLNKINTGSASSTTCSSASSFSRSCLSKTPSSNEKSKRSVRFIDEEQSDRESVRKATEIRVMEENRRVIEAAKELLRNYQKVNVSDDDEDDDEEDLFELDHLSVKFREELPVYETTRLNTNRTISR